MNDEAFELVGLPGSIFILEIEWVFLFLNA